MTPGLPGPLASYLASGHRIAERLAVSIERVGPLFPPDATLVEQLSADDQERLDAFLYRFASLAASVQDQVGRALLLTEEESLASASRKDQRLLKRLGALDETLEFGDVAELRNRLALSYPNEPRKQAEIMSLAYAKAPDLIAAFNGMLGYAARWGDRHQPARSRAATLDARVSEKRRLPGSSVVNPAAPEPRGSR